MVRCKDSVCEKYGDNRCCLFCDCRDTCDDVCQFKDHTTCGFSEGEANDLDVFQIKAIMVMQGIADISYQKQMLDARDKDLRKQLEAFMDQFGIQKFENDLLKVTYIAPSTRTSIDSTRLKKELPAIAEKYSKTSQVKGSVRIEVK